MGTENSGYLMDLETHIPESQRVAIITSMAATLRSPMTVIMNNDGSVSYLYNDIPEYRPPLPKPTQRTYGPTKRKKW